MSAISPRVTDVLSGSRVARANPATLVAAYAAAVAANGGSVSAGRQAIINTFITAELASGAWSLTDDYWPMWAEDAAGSLTSLKQRRLATAVAAPTFTTDRGYAFNGTTQYIDTGWIASQHATAMTLGNVRVAAYERTNVAANTNTLGVSVTGQQTLILRARNTIDQILGQLQTSAFTFASITDSRGYTAISRAGNGSTGKGYKNGVAQTDASGLTSGATTLESLSLYLAATNSNGSAATFRTCSLGIVCVGAPLNAAQELAQYNAVQAWATSIGANV